MVNPKLLAYFAQTDTFRVEIPQNMLPQGWSEANPLVGGRQLNQLFWQIFEFLNFQKQHGFSYYDENDTHKVGHLKRHLNKIYFCKLDNDVDNKQAPVSNKDYWDIFLDLDKPIYDELLNYASKNGNALNLFKVKAAESNTDAVNLLQMNNALSKVGLGVGFQYFGDEAHTNELIQTGGEFNRADHLDFWNDYLSQSPLLKTETEWQTENTANISSANPNGMCGYFSSGNGSTTFRLKNLEGATLKAVNGVDELAGRFEIDQVLSHNHRLNGNSGGTGYANSAAEGAYAGTMGSINPTESTGGIENTVKNIGALPLIVVS